MYNKQESALSKAITVADAKIQLDEKAKEILSNKTLLSRIMKDCVDELKDYDCDYIEHNCFDGDIHVSTDAVNEGEPDLIQMDSTESASMKNGTIRFDVKYTAKVSDRIRVIINVEMQRRERPKYSIVTRGMYYCSRMISDQYNRVFTGKNYNELRKVYSIWICPNVANIRSGSIATYTVVESTDNEEAKADVTEYDKLKLAIIRLGKAGVNTSKELVDMLSTLFDAKYDVNLKKRELADKYNLKMSYDVLRSVNDMCNYSDYVYDIGIEQGKAEAKAEVEQARAEAEQAKAEAEQAKMDVEKARAEAESKAKRIDSIIRTMVKSGTPVNIVVEMCGVDRGYIERIMKEE